MIIIFLSIVIALGFAVYNRDEYAIFQDIAYFMFVYSIPMGALGSSLLKKLKSTTTNGEEYMVNMFLTFNELSFSLYLKNNLYLIYKIFIDHPNK